MIILKTLKWSNLFSYGKDNVIRLDEHPIVQLVGKNGHGKSSIPLVLEEVLFNKNSKGIKKADILNRHIKDKAYSISLTFEKDGSEYLIETTRGSSQTVSLFKDGDNISAHTATATFKLIEEILGFDNKTFSQLVYQSSSASLEFLTATDTNRKKFLIDLLNLSKYVEAFDVFKKIGKEAEIEVAALNSKVQTTQAWLDKHSKENLDEIELKGVPVLPEEVIKNYHSESAKLTTISSTNKKIQQNNIYKQQLANIDISQATEAIPLLDSTEYTSKQGEHRNTIKTAKALITKVDKLDGVCPTCMQKVDKQLLDSIVAEQTTLISSAEEAITTLDKLIKEVNDNNTRKRGVEKLKSDWETYHNLVDNTLPEDTLDAEAIQAKITDLKKQIDRNTAECDKIIEYNNKASAHNSKVSVIKSQMQGMQSDLKSYGEDLALLQDKLNTIQILQKVFSTNGLIAYKIECLVKDLELLANEYLAELSGGRFQLTFKVNSGDKLNVIITDNGRDIDILALSGGERARVNTAALLAIRRLMQSLSNVRINLLILDETIDALDVDGKEKLVEVLLKEEHLNTFLVSHGFTHPLLEKIMVIKENNISRLE